MFYQKDDAGYHCPISGIRQKTLVYGKNTLMTEFILEAGSVLPMHRHPHEQTGYLLTGKLELTVGAETRVVSAGDAWCVPGDCIHGATVLEDSVAVEVFSPVRTEYIPEIPACA